MDGARAERRRRAGDRPPPARDVLHAQLVGTIAAPLSGLVRGLNALIAGVAIQLQQIADQGLVSGEAPAAPPKRPRPEAAVEPEAEAAAEPEAEPAAEPEPRRLQSPSLNPRRLRSPSLRRPQSRARV